MPQQLTFDILALIFGNISIIMSIAIEFPQLYKIVKTKNTSGTSLISYFLFLITSIIFLSWSFVFYLSDASNQETEMTFIHLSSFIPAILSNTINICLILFILFFKCKNLLICKKDHINELQLSKRIFTKNMHKRWIKKYYPLILISLITLIICALEIVILWYTNGPKVPDVEEHEMYTMVTMVLNIAAAVMFEVISWPQFIKCIRKKDTSGISIGWAIFLPVSCFVCLAYNIFLGLSSGITKVLASIIFNGSIINTLILILKIRNIMKAKKFHITEFEYTQKYLQKKEQ